MSDRVRRALERPSVQLTPENARRAAVALVLDRDETVLFIKRAEKRGDPWSGHVGLPGGHLDGEEGFVQAAIRETAEEVGLALPHDGLLGQLNDRRTPATLPTKLVRPLVFRVERFGQLRLQSDEVASVHPLPLDALLRGEGRTLFELEHGGNRWTLPAVDFDGVRLWGMTLAVIDDLLHRIDGNGVGLARVQDLC